MSTNYTPPCFPSLHWIEKWVDLEKSVPRKKHDLLPTRPSMTALERSPRIQRAANLDVFSHNSDTLVPSKAVMVESMEGAKFHNYCLSKNLQHHHSNNLRGSIK